MKLPAPTPKPPTPRASPRASIEILERPGDLDAIASDWADLAANAVERNVFYEPWMLRPALRHFGAGSRFRFALVWQQPKGPPKKGRRPLLIGLFPFQIAPARPALPVARLRLWRWDYGFLCTPLLREGYGVESVSACFDWLERQRAARGPLDVSKFPGDGRVHQLWVDELERRGWIAAIRHRHTRAILRPQPGTTGDDYERWALSSKKRKELRRQRHRLEDSGELVVDRLPDGAPASDVEARVDEFASLEAAGWKGQERTALASNPSHLAFFREVAVAAHERGNLLMSRLTVDGATVATKASFASGPAAFAFKIAFDESYARYSPGVLLELDNIHHVCEHMSRADAPRWMDSCATSNHPMINHLWTERRTIEHLMVSFNRTGDLLLSLVPLARAARRARRATARQK